MFQFRRFPSYTYFIQCRIPCGGFPHSEISGSQLICNSPKLIAAYHVLHRLLMPRHSPCALISLTYSLGQLKEKSIWFSYSWILQAHRRNFFRLAKIVFYPKKIILYCCLLIIASIITMFSFQGALESQRNSMKYLLPGTSVNSLKVVEISGIEPLTSCLQGRRSPSWAKPPYPFSKWWAKMDSNHRPHDYQSCALASWAIGPYQLHFFMFRYISSVPSKLNNVKCYITLYWP